MKKTILMTLIFLSVTFSVHAALKPTEVIHRDGEEKTVEKVYVLPADEPEEPIATDSFTEGDVKYEFAELLREDNMADDTKDYSESFSLKSSTDDTQSIIAMFEPTKEISTEDGYTGTVEADFSTLSVKSEGVSSQSYTVTERRSYPNMDSADTSAVPKTIVQNGTSLELTDIEWVSSVNDSIDGQNLAVRYTANAVYSGTGTRTYSKGYNAAVVYKGQITKKVVGTVTYTAVFREANGGTDIEPVGEQQTENENGDANREELRHRTNPLLYLLYIPMLALLIAGGYVVYRIVRKKDRDIKLQT